jgi:hypothetical protein
VAQAEEVELIWKLNGAVFVLGWVAVEMLRLNRQ